MKLAETVSSFKSFLVRNKKRIIEVGIGRFVYEGIAVLTDDYIWPLMIVLFGWKGAVGMSAFSLIQCAVTLVIYQRMGKDWLGIAVIEDARTAANEKVDSFFAWRGESFFGTIIVWVVKVFLIIPALASRVALWLLDFRATRFFGLGILQDPFQMTAYFKNADFSEKSLTKRDWLIFLASWAWSNIYWNFHSTVVAFIVVWFFRIVRGH